ncbi:hypothetical protein B1B04_24100 [Lysinibacillus sp. KCTC 33748]|nr:hypothetical protein B1B04_24100 [Lysinibacillus sp. KCTC 33748]SKC17723.1 hypothetical protein SAMN06295926_13523 [Lysinibacillus sp. AC-3]
MGISVTDETLERAMLVKRLIGRPQESAQPQRKSTPHYCDDPYFYMNRQYLFNYFIDQVKNHIIKGMKTISFALLGETNVHPRKIFLVQCMYLRYNLQ